MTQRTTFSTRRLLAGALALVAFGAAPGVAQAGTLQVVPVGLGSVTVSPPATTAAPPDQVNFGACTPTGTAGGRTDLGGACTLTYPAGTTVTLRASGGDADADGPQTTFRRWSDDRCPGAGPCNVTVGADDQTVAALFSPQRVSVVIAGDGGVTSAPGDLHDGCAQGNLCGDFDPDSPLTLTAVGTAGAIPTWLPNDSARGVLCDAPPDTTCTVLPAWPRWVSVGFGSGNPPQPAFPPEITVNFRVGKTGSGSGTIRSGSVDCGGNCTTRATFGANETFTASPDNGSRFTGWRAACGTAATCRLAVGPVTSLTAVFDKAAGGVAGNGAKNPGTKPRPRRRAFAARVLRIGVSGHGRRRILSIRLRVNAVATVRARLLRGRRQVASHRWRVRRSGTTVLRMRVPARAHSGSYRLRVSVSGRGRTVRFTRAVRVRR